jgi:predicted nucleic acid-binding protein
LRRGRAELADYVLDTSAVMTVLEAEDGQQTVRELIDGGADCTLPFIVIMEVEYKLLAKKVDRVDDALNLVWNWPVSIVESDASWGRIAAQVKAQGGLSVADSWIASLALIQDATLVHKDPEFEPVNGLKHLKLPYKARRS